jgi:hypothetical protein
MLGATAARRRPSTRAAACGGGLGQAAVRASMQQTVQHGMALRAAGREGQGGARGTTGPAATIGRRPLTGLRSRSTHRTFLLANNRVFTRLARGRFKTSNAQLVSLSPPGRLRLQQRGLKWRYSAPLRCCSGMRRRASVAASCAPARARGRTPPGWFCGARLLATNQERRAFARSPRSLAAAAAPARAAGGRLLSEQQPGAAAAPEVPAPAAAAVAVASAGGAAASPLLRVVVIPTMAVLHTSRAFW